MELLFSKADPADLDLWQMCVSGKYTDPVDLMCPVDLVYLMDPLDTHAFWNLGSENRSSLWSRCYVPETFGRVDFPDSFSGESINRFLKLFFYINRHLLQKYFRFNQAQYVKVLQGILFFPFSISIFLKSYWVYKKNLRIFHRKLFKLYYLINFISY